MHQLPFGASISDSVLAALTDAAVSGRAKKPKMIPEIRLVERCGDALAGLRPTPDGRLSFHAEPVNPLVAYSALPAPGLDWTILLLDRKFAHSVFRIGHCRVEIGEEAQRALRGSVLDLVGGKMVATASV